ncbi:MAG: PRTRC system ThiF family protein, partial [Verrucomicrobiota bacterium]
MKHSLPTSFTDREIDVTVAGAGGNGSQIVSGLARMHLSLLALGHRGLRVKVYDPDVVTEANVGRQLFSPSDVGCYKSEVLVHRLNCFFNLDWRAEPVKYQRGSGSTQLLIGCVDSASARRELLRTEFQYWLDLGNNERKGQVILGQKLECDFKNSTDDDDEDDGHTVLTNELILARKNAKDRRIAQRLPNVMEIFPELMNGRRKEDNAPSCSLAAALERQDLYINQTVATFALQLLWQFIRQGGLDIHGYFINLESGRVTPLPIEQRPHPEATLYRRTRSIKPKTKKGKRHV